MRSALVLNASFEPLSVVSAQRATCLVLAEKADLVEGDGHVLHSASLSVPCPSVIRLRYMVKVPFVRRRRAVAPGDLRPRRPPLPVLRRARRLDRSRRAAVEGRAALVGERRRGLPAVQPHQARSHARRSRDAPRPSVPRAARHRLGDRVGQRHPRHLAAVPADGVLSAALLRFSLEHTAGPARSLHDRAIPDPAHPTIWWHEVTDRRSCSARASPSRRSTRSPAPRAGIDVVRRRSGGGAVLLVPGEVFWLDVIVPRQRDTSLDDVRASMCRIGSIVCDALVAAAPGLAERRRGAPRAARDDRVVVDDLLRRPRPR